MWLSSPSSMSLLTITRWVIFFGKIWSAQSAKIPRERAHVEIPWWHGSLITCKEQGLLTTGEGQKMSWTYCFLIIMCWAELWADCSSRALLMKAHLSSTIPCKSVSFREHRGAPSWRRARVTTCWYNGSRGLSAARLTQSFFLYYKPKVILWLTQRTYIIDFLYRY